MVETLQETPNLNEEESELKVNENRVDDSKVLSISLESAFNEENQDLLLKVQETQPPTHGSSVLIPRASQDFEFLE